jgi:hypothetical protein
MAEVLVRIEYIIAGAIAIAALTAFLYMAVSRVFSSYFVRHWFIFLDDEGKVKEIVKKTIRRTRNKMKYKKAEYIFDPTHKYHIMSYDEKNELRIRKDGVIDSLIKSKTVEEYELMAFSLLSRLLQAKLRAIDMVMLLMMGIILAAVIYGFMHGQK